VGPSYSLLQFCDPDLDQSLARWVDDVATFNIIISKVEHARVTSVYACFHYATSFAYYQKMVYACRRKDLCTYGNNQRLKSNPLFVSERVIKMHPLSENIVVNRENIVGR
jgi:hypothetical protein